MPSHTHRRGLLVVVSTLVGLAAAAPAAVASSGKIVGRLTGLPAHAQFAAVRAVDARGVIAAVSQASSAGAYSLSVKPGVYVVMGEAANNGTRAFDATGVPTRVRSGRRTTATTRLHFDRGASGRSAEVPLFAHASAGGVNAPLRRGAVMTFGAYATIDERITPSLFEGPDRREVVTNHFYAPCTRRGVILVDTSPEFTAFAKQEAALQRAGRLDPRTPYAFHPIKPQFSTNGDTVIVKPGTGSHPGIPTLTQDIFTIDHPEAKLHHSVGVENSDFLSFNGPVDDTFITATLITQANKLAAEECP